MAKFKDKYVSRVMDQLSQKIAATFGFTPSEDLSLTIAKELGFVSGEKGRYGGTSVKDDGLKFLFKVEG